MSQQSWISTEGEFEPATDWVAGAEVDIDAAGATDIGRQREHNEDQYLVGYLRRSMWRSSSITADGWALGGGEGTLLCVSDGVAGLPGGEIASAIAVDAVARHVLSDLPWLQGSTSVPTTRELVRIRAALEAAFHTAHRTMTVGHEPMAATLTVAFVMWPALYLAHVGDSRCYRYSARKKELTQLTRDHTMAEVMRTRGLQPDEALDDILWNTLGGQESDPQMDFARFDLADDDRVLVCSDGLVKHVSDERIREILAAAAPSAELCRRLIDEALKCGGSDNVTAVVARGSARE